MKRFYFLSVITMVSGLIGLFGLDASAQLKRQAVNNSGNAKAVGGNGGNATGKGAQGGNGGSAKAQGGSVFPSKLRPKSVTNSGNAEAKGGNGGDANGKDAKAGNGGDANAKGGDIGQPKKVIPIDPGIGNGKKPIIPIDPGIGNGKKPAPPKVGGDIGSKPPVVDPGFPKGGNVKNDKKKKGPNAGGGGGGQAKAGDAEAKGGNGGDANGKGAKGGNGGDAIAVSGNGNTVINGDNNTVIGKVVNNNISINVGGGGFGGGGGGFGGGGFGGGFVTECPAAFAQGGAGGDGFVPGAPGQAIASGPSETVITNDGSPAIAQGANGKSNVEDGEVEQIFTRRFLKVKNDSGKAMKVFVQFRGQDDKKWAWTPADPNESKEAITYDLEPGQEMFLQHKGSKLSASRVRIWGTAAGQNWFDFRDQDLWVVPEMDQRGEHRYQATEMRTFTFVFPKQDETESK